MSVRRVGSRLHRVHLLRAALVAAVAALALPAAAAQGGLLEITVGPHETTWLQLAELQVLLDGAPLRLAGPAAGPSQRVYSDVVAPGRHRVDVKAGFIGDSTAFSYVQGYVFRMQGQLDFDATAGEAVGVQVTVIDVQGLTVEWTDRFKLALQASSYQSARAAAAQVPDPEPTAAAAAAPPATEPEPPAAAVVPAALEEPRPAPACALEPPRFAFGRYTFDADGRASLDRFAACLAASSAAVMIEGFADPRGSGPFNERLGEQRASAVAEYLVQRGVARSRLTVRSLGATRLVCSEASEACHARNRRAEAVVTSGL